MDHLHSRDKKKKRNGLAGTDNLSPPSGTLNNRDKNPTLNPLSHKSHSTIVLLVSYLPQFHYHKRRFSSLYCPFSSVRASRVTARECLSGWLGVDGISRPPPSHPPHAILTPFYSQNTQQNPIFQPSQLIQIIE